MRHLLLATTFLAAVGATHAKADINLWIDDTSGNIGLVDITTQTVVAGTVHNTGQILTDIGFVGTQMYGTTFTGLFRIDDTTGASTAIGSYGGVGGGGMNALVGNGASLLGASNASLTDFSINPTTGAATAGGPIPLPSAGDLAFDHGVLFLSATNTSGGDSLVNVSGNSVVGAFSPSESAVFGLANDGTTTYAVDGTEIFSVNVATAALTPLFNYAGAGLGAANGTAFIAEGPSGAIPEPSTWAMMALGFGLLGLVGYRKTRSGNALA
jgi:PEP-CTERM motif